MSKIGLLFGGVGLAISLGTALRVAQACEYGYC